MLQSFMSLFFVMSVLCGSLLNFYLITIVFYTSLVFKLAIFPLHSWIFKISNSLSMSTFFLLMTSQKFYLYFILFMFIDEYLFYLLFFSMCLGSLYLFWSRSVKEIVISSSIYSTFLMYFLFLISPLVFLLFFLLFYSPFVFLLCNWSILYLSSFGMFLSCCTLLFFLGLPPFSMFTFKMSLIMFLSNFFSLFKFMIFWIFTFISSIGYFFSLYSCFIFNYKFYCIKFLNQSHFFMSFLFLIAFMTFYY